MSLWNTKPMSRPAKLCAATAFILLVLLIWAIGTGENGDAGFAMLSAAIAAAAFAIGAWSASWLVPIAVAVCWFLGWMVGGTTLAPSSYAAATAFIAPAVGLFAALGVGTRRGRR